MPSLGSVSVTLGLTIGDFTSNIQSAVSALESLKGAFDQVATAIQAASAPLEGFSASVSAALAGVDQSFGSTSNASQVMVSALTMIATQLNGIAQSASVATSALTQIATGMQQTAGAASGTGQAINNINSSMGRFAVLRIARGMIDDFMELGSAIITATDEVDRATLSLGLLIKNTYDAQGVIVDLANYASGSAFSFSELAGAAQKFAALGVAAQNIVPTLNAVANAAAATGNSFGAVESAFARVADTGVVTQRALVTLGISWQELASTIGQSVAQTKDAFSKGMLDAQTALAAVRDTTNSVFTGAADLMTQTISGAFQELKNQITILLSSLGDSLKPLAMQFIDAFSGMLPAIQQAIDAFNGLSPAMQEAIVGGTVLAGVVLPALAIGLVGAGLAIAGITAVLPEIIIAAEVFSGLAVAVALVHFSGLADDAMAAAQAITNNWTGIKDLFSGLAPYINDATVAFQLLTGTVGGFSNLIAELKASFDYLSTALGGISSDATGALGKLDALFSGSWVSNIANTVAPIAALKESLISIGGLAEQLGGNFATMNAAALTVSTTLGGTVHTAMQQMANDALAVAAAQDKLYKQQQAAAQIAAALAAQASKALAAWNDTFGRNAEDVANSMDSIASGETTISSVLSKVTGLLTEADKNWDKLNSTGVNLVQQVLVPMQTSLQKMGQDQTASAAMQKLADSMVKVQEQATVLADKVPISMTDMMAGVAQGMNFQGLDTKIQTEIQKMTTMLAEMPAALDGQVGSGFSNFLNNILIPLQGRLQDFVNTFKLLGQDTAIAKLTTDMTSFNTVFAAGGLSADMTQAALNGIAATINSKVLPAFAQGIPLTSEFINELEKLPDIGPALAAAANKGFDAFTTAVQTVVESTREASLSINSAFKDLGVTSIDAAAATITKAGGDIITIFKNVSDASTLSSQQMSLANQTLLDWGNKVLPLMIQTGDTISKSVLDQIAKINPAFALAASQGPSALQAAVAHLASTTQSSVQTMTDAFTVFGQKSAQALQDQINKEQEALNILISTGAPLQAILSAQTKISSDMQQYAVYTGQSAEDVLKLTESMTEASAQQNALKSDAMALANVYSTMLNDFDKAWTSLGKGLGDAIVSGQNFGAAFTKVLDDLKKQLAELVVNSLLGQLKNALIENTNIVANWAKAFNDFFGVANTATKATTTAVQGVATATSKAVQEVIGDGDELTNAAKSTASSLTDASKSMQTASTNIASSATSLFQSFSLIAEAVGAIAGIIGDIEQARTNDLLGEIEVSTRATKEQVISIQETLNQCAASLQTMVDFNNSFWSTYFGQALSDLEMIITNTANGGGGGGGASSGDITSLTQALQALQTQVTGLTEDYQSVDTQSGIDANNVANIMSNTGNTVGDLGTSASAATQALTNLGTTAGNSDAQMQAYQASIKAAYAAAGLDNLGSGSIQGTPYYMDGPNIDGSVTTTTTTGGQPSGGLALSKTPYAIEDPTGASSAIGFMNFGQGPAGSTGIVPGGNPFQYVDPNAGLRVNNYPGQQIATTNPAGLNNQTSVANSLTLHVQVTNADETTLANKLIQTWRRAGVPI